MYKYNFQLLLVLIYISIYIMIDKLGLGQSLGKTVSFLNEIQLPVASLIKL